MLAIEFWIWVETLILWNVSVHSDCLDPSWIFLKFRDGSFPNQIPAFHNLMLLRNRKFEGLAEFFQLETRTLVVSHRSTKGIGIKAGSLGYGS